MSTPTPRGEIVVFYSYKGGTGRSMALANVACLLADNSTVGGGVLVVDWDLEAPGLHRFFPERLAAKGLDPDLGLDHREGLIDLLLRLEAVTPATPPVSEEDADERVATALGQIDLDRFVVDTGIVNLRLLRAGRNDDGKYSERVNTFHWESLFHRSPILFRAFADRLAARYRYVLIDSRTGLTDMSGICTCLLPEKLVVVFTPNRQSLTGLRNLVERATRYRRQSDDLRPLVVFPLPSRIEASREDLRTQWRFGDQERGIQGYQPMFEDIFTKAYGLAECRLGPYFEEVQIQQSPDYAYGEEIAVKAEHTADRFSLSSSYKVFTEWLRTAPAPWQRHDPAESLRREQQSRQHATVGQRRNATVMFAEIAGFSAMSEKMDPEGVSSIINLCFSSLGEVATAHGGYVDKYIGDCVMALFGVGAGLERAPQQALRAALEMRRRLRRLSEDRVLPVPLDLHVGVNTGLVIAGHVGGDVQEFTVVGDAVNLASRLKDAAPGGAIWVGSETYEHVREEFEFRKVALALKGRAHSVKAYELLSAKKP